MKKLISDFLSLLSDSLLVLALIISGFLVLINIYHSNYISYVANVNYNEFKDIKKFKDNIREVEEIFNTVNLNNLSYNDRTIATSIKNFAENSLKAIKGTDFYKLGDFSTLTYKNVYDYNDKLLMSLSYDGLFYLPYNVGIQVRGTIHENSFKEVSEKFANVKANVDLSLNYVRNLLLANSNYSYITNVTRTTIFNELTSTFALVSSNYEEFSHSLLVLANWYASEFGGVA